MKTTFCFLAAALCSIFATTADADVIDWQASVQMFPGTTTQAFVDNSSGDFVLGFNATGENATADTDPSVNGTTTLGVNGVDFQNVNGFNLEAGVVTGSGVSVTTDIELGNDSNAFGDGSFGGDGDIFALIAGGVFNNTGASIEFTGLTVGDEYFVQIFTNDARTGRDADWAIGFSDGENDFATSVANGTAGTSRLSNRDVDDATVGEPGGDFIIGTWVATSSTQSFDFIGTRDNFASTGPSTQIQGLQLRNLGTAVPEPGSLAVLGLGVFGLVTRRRRK